MESHFQGLEESSYLVEGENTHLKKIFLSKACQQSKMGGKMRDILEKTVPPPSSRGRLGIRTLLQSPLLLPPPFFSPPAQTCSPIRL